MPKNKPFFEEGNILIKNQSEYFRFLPEFDAQRQNPKTKSIHSRVKQTTSTLILAVYAVFTILTPIASASGNFASNYNQPFKFISNLTQNLKWGVLAINPNKDVYRVGETAHFAMGVLDEKGNMACDAKLSLAILNESGKGWELTTQNGRIKINPECQIKNYTSKPDFEASFVFNKEGKYQLILSAETKNGKQIIYDTVSVNNQVQPFEIKRLAPTRLYPLIQYPVQVEITANKDFIGTVEEVLPKGFKIIGKPKSQKGGEEDRLINILNNRWNDSAEATVNTLDGVTKIVSNINLRKGEKQILYYTFDAPDINPEFYEMQKIKLVPASGEPALEGESRQWQFANDAVAVKTGSFAKKTSTGAQQITGMGFEPKAIIFYWTGQITDNAFLNTGASASNSRNTSFGMGIASETGTATSSAAVGLCEDSTGTNGTTSDSKQRVSSTSTIIILDGGGNTATCSATLLGKGVVTSMDTDGFTLNWSVASTSPNIIRYYALGGSDITNATTGNFTIGTGSTGLNNVTTGFAPDMVFYLSGDTATVDNNIADANLNFGFSTAATSTEQAVESFAVNDAAGTAVSRNTQTTASSTAVFSSAVTALDMAFRTWSLNSTGFTVNVDDPPAANVSIFYLAIKGGAHFVAATTSPTSTGVKSTTGVGFKPEGMFVTTNGLTATNALNNSVALSVGAVGWSTTTGVSATSSVGLVGISELNGDTLPSNVYDTRSTNSLVKSYFPIATDNISPTVFLEAYPNTFDTNGFSWNFVTATTTAKQILYWAVGPSPNISGNVYSNEGVTGLASSRTIKLVTYDGTATTTYSTTTVASTGRYDFFNVPYGRGDILTFYLDGATEKATTVYHASTSKQTNLTGIDLYQNYVILRTATTTISMVNSDLAGVDGDNDLDIDFISNSGNLTASSTKTLFVWNNTTYIPGGTVTTQGAGGDFKLATSSVVTLDNSTNAISGDIIAASSSVLNINANTTVSGGDITTIASGTITTTAGTPTVTISGTGTIGGGTATTTFYNLTTSGSGNTTLATTTVITNDLSVGSGTTLSGSSNVYVQGGDLTGDGTINLTGGTLEMQGAGNFGGNTAWTFYNLNIGNGTTDSATSTGTGAVTVSSALTVSSTSILNAGPKQWNLTGTGTPLTVTGSLNASTSTFSFKGTTGTTTVPTLAYYNLDISPASGAPKFIFATTSTDTVTFNASSTGKCITTACGAGSNQLTYSLTVNSGNNRGLAVFVTVTGNSNDTQPQISSVTYAGVNLSQKVHTTTKYYTDLWTLPDGIQPATGANNIVITLASALVGSVPAIVSGAIAANNVNQTTAWTTTASSTGQSAAPSLTLGASGSGDMVISGVCNGTSIASTAQTLNYKTADDLTTACSSAAGATAAGNTTAISWTTGNDFWNLIAAAFKGASALYSTTSIANAFTISGPATVDSTTNKVPVNVIGDMTIGSNSTFLADSSAFLTLSGSYTNRGTFTNNSGTVLFNAGSTGKTITASTSPFYNLTFNGSGGGWTLMDNSTTSNALIIQAGTLSASSTTINLPGSATDTPLTVLGTFTAASSTVSFASTTGTTLVASTTYYNLVFSPTSGTPTFRLQSGTTTVGNNLTLNGAGNETLDVNTNDGPLDINGSVTINSGDTFSASNSGVLAIAGNFTNSGTFTHNSGTIIFDSIATSTISSTATTTFNNFTVTTQNKEIRFQKATSYVPAFTIAGTFTITGAASNPVLLNSDTAGSQWLVNFSGAQSSLTYVKLKDSGCYPGSASATLDANSTNVSNNGTCWIFATNNDYSGTVYVSDGGAVIGSGKTVYLYKNGSIWAGSATTDSSGAYSMTASTTITTGEALLFYINDDAIDANTVVLATTGSQTGINLYGSALAILSGATAASSVTNTILNTAKVSSDIGDMTYSVSGGNLTASSTYEIYVLNGSASTDFAPGGTVSTGTSTSPSASSGDFKVASGSVVSMLTNALTVGGDFLNYGTFNKSSGQTTTFTGSSTGFSVISGSSTLDTVIFNNTAGSWSFAPSWYSSSWSYRKAITIDHNKVASSTGELYADFPLLISRTDSDLKATSSSGYVGRADGGDILFTLSDGTTKLNHELEKYSSTTGETIAWVRLPLLSTSTDTTLYMYYGNYLASSQATTTGVWDSNYKGVWHLGDVAGDVTHSNDSAGGIVGTKTNVTEIDGKIGKAESFTLSTSRLSLADNSVFTWTPVDEPRTFSAWFYPTALPASGIPQPIFSADATGANKYLATFINDATFGNILTIYITNNSFTTISQFYYAWTPTLSQWYKIDFVASSAGNNKIYINGVAYTPIDEPVQGWNDNAQINPSTTVIGNVLDSYGVDKSLDEVRLSNSIRSADWIKTEYNNQNSTTTFYSVGSQETAYSSSTLDGSITITAGTLSGLGSLTLGGSLTISSGGTFVAGLATTSIVGNLTVSGAFTHNNGTVVFAPTSTSTISGTGEIAFYNIVSTSQDKEIRFQKASNSSPVFSILNNLVLTGQAGHNILLNSDTAGSQWLVKFNQPQTNITYVYIKDSGCHSGSSSVTQTGKNNSDGGNNDNNCWNFIIISRGGGSSGGNGGGAASDNGGNPDGGGSGQTGGGSGGGGGGSESGGGGGGGQTGGGSGGGGGGASP